MSSLFHALIVALAMYAPSAPAVLSEVAAPAVTAMGQQAVLAECPSPTLTPDETRVLALLNAARAERGLAPLAVDPTLIGVARAHCADMERRNYFSHWEPDAAHRNPVDRYAAVLGHKPTVVVGENLGTFIKPDFDAIQLALMNSPTHRANVLHPQYTYTGIGVLVRPDGNTWVTQMFRGGSEKAG